MSTSSVLKSVRYMIELLNKIFKKDLFIYFLYMRVLSICTSAYQKMASSSIIDSGCKVPCEF